MRWTICFVHGFILLLFSLFWLNLPFTLPDEALLIKLSAVFNKLVLQNDPKPDPKRFVFINVGSDKALLKSEDGKTQAITNRKHLSQLFQVLNKHTESYQFVLCDVFFEEKSRDDQALKKEIEGLNHVLVPVRIEDDKIKKPIFNVPYGTAVYSSSPEGEVYKYRLISKCGYKSLPLLMYEHLYQKKITKGFLLHRFEKKWSLNGLVLDLKIRNHDIIYGELYKRIQLFELLPLLEANEKTFFDLYLKDRIIVLGDFDNDKVQSSFGDLSGSLLLLNVFLMLEDGQNFFPNLLLITLILFYTICSYFLFYKPVFKRFPRVERFRSAKFARTLSYLICLMAFSTFSYMIFDIHLNVLIITIYLGLVAFLRKIILKKKTLLQLCKELMNYFYLSKTEYKKHLEKTN